MPQTTHRHPLSLYRRLPNALVLGGLLLAVTCLGHSRATARDQNTIVLEFRDALKVDRDSTSKEALAYRAKTLEEAGKKVHELGNLTQVLLLLEWRPDVDQEALKTMGDKFESALRAELKDDGHPTRQEAAAILIRETVASTRKISVKETRSSPLTERLANVSGDLKTLIESPKTDPAARAAAVAALGGIEPVLVLIPEGATRQDVIDSVAKWIKPQYEDLEGVLKKEVKSNDVAVRLAAVQSLADLTQGLKLFGEKHNLVTGTGAKRAESERMKWAADGYRLESMKRILEAAASALKDPDPRVRRISVEVCKIVASNMEFMVKSQFPLQTEIAKYPPPGRPWTMAERDTFAGKKRDLDELGTILTPLLQEFETIVPNLAQTASADPAQDVRVEANHALENLALARQRLVELRNILPVEKTSGMESEVRRSANLPATPMAFAPVSVLQPALPIPAPVDNVRVGRAVAFQETKAPEDPLKGVLRQNIQTVSKSLTSPDRAVRLAALDAIETIGDDAAPAIPALIQATSNDDPFTRWSAVRILGRLSAKDARGDAVVRLAELTRDERYDVRLAAISSLERYGPALKGMDQAKQAVAVQYLGHKAMSDDAEVRIAAMKALQAIGAPAAAALPAVAKNLIAFNKRLLPRPDDYPDAYQGGKNLTEDDAVLRQTACQTLGQIGLQVAKADPNGWKEAAPAILKVLKQSLSDPDPEVRRAAGDAMLKVLAK